MSNQQKSSPATSFLGYVIGLVLMVGGTWASFNVHLDFIQKLNDQGIPIDLFKSIAVIGVLIFVFPIIKFFFINDLSAALDSRNNQLVETFTEAENLRADMKKMRSDYEARLAETEASAREQIQNQIKEAQHLRQQLTAEAAERADALLKQAELEIEQEKNNAIRVIQTHVVELTLAAAEKVIGENMDSAKNRRLITEFIDKVEVGS